MTLRALGEAPVAIGRPLLRSVLASSDPIRPLAEEEEAEPGGLVRFRPGDDEMLRGSDQAIAGLLLARQGDTESLPAIRRLARGATDEDGAILREAVGLLEEEE